MDIAKIAKVANKDAAAIQITAEQILREAKERQEAPPAQIAQKITDEEELMEYRFTKRIAFENDVRRNRTAIGAWLKYAKWEEAQDEMERARSIFERALEHEHRNQSLWLKYSEMEMRHKNINRARNIYDRAVAILPKVDMFWYKYTYMEELIDNPQGARQIFERWMKWEPEEEGWMAYVKFEIRYKEFERARAIFRRFVSCFPQPSNWIKYAKFEEQQGNIDTSRQIYEQCIETLGESYIDQNIYISFAKFETRHKEIERARAIYSYALEKLPVGEKENLYNVYAQFEKQYGSKEGVEDVIVSKRRLKYEQELENNPLNYDLWFDYIRLEESNGRPEKIRQVFERAISNIPLVEEKRYYRRYIYLWIMYAIWEELDAEDPTRAQQVYRNALSIIPHEKFTFAKLWKLYAEFLIRKKDLNSARKLMGRAIGKFPKEKLYKNYIELELSLREFDRARILYEKYLEWNPANVGAWIRFAELERQLGDTDRARGIFDIAVSQSELDLPEVLWKAYLDFEVEEEEWTNARSLYEQLLERTMHVKIQISFANFEFIAKDNGEVEERASKARARFQKSYDWLKDQFLKDERAVLLEAWLAFERKNGTDESIKLVEDKCPKAVKKRRKIQNEDGSDAGWEEYYDYIFPEDDTEAANVKLLALAHEWKQKQAEESSEEESDSE